MPFGGFFFKKYCFGGKNRDLQIDFGGISEITSGNPSQVDSCNVKLFKFKLKIVNKILNVGWIIFSELKFVVEDRK